jgi:predicted enzyme related to lactoylglutathione lyase
MKKTTLIILALVTSFGFGFGFKTIITKQSNYQHKMKKVTGIGGIFFKCKDPNKMEDWYKTHLGLNTNQYGTVFEWHQGEDSTKKGFTQWSPFDEKTKYFEPSTKDFMINYRVENIETLVAELKKNGVTIVDTIETFDYGKFIHILDFEGNKVELWEPNDIEYEKLAKQLGSKTTK